MFGRKKVQHPPAPPPPPPPVDGGAEPADPRQHPGHQAVLRHLAETDKTDPATRLQLAGRIVFDLFCDLLQNEGRVRMEDLLGALGSIGGHCCLTAVLEPLEAAGRRPQDAGLLVAQGQDGNVYYFGDAPNRLLLESNWSLLSLTLGAAHQLGAPVTLESVYETIDRTAAAVGKPGFGEPRLPEGHKLNLTPMQFVEHGRRRMIDAFDLYDVRREDRPSAIGFAIARAIDAGKDAIDPLLAAQVVTECAVPMAKVDPRRFS